MICEFCQTEIVKGEDIRIVNGKPAHKDCVDRAEAEARMEK